MELRVLQGRAFLGRVGTNLLRFPRDGLGAAQGDFAAGASPALLSGWLQEVWAPLAAGRERALGQLKALG